MEIRPLTETEEQLGDQIAGLFYTDSGGSLLPQISQLTTGLSRDVVELITELTLLRLYNEQAIRKQYLLQQLNIPEDAEAEAKLLSATAPPSPTSDLSSQLLYHKVVTTNLTRFEVETWQAEHQEMLKALLHQPRPTIAALGQSLKTFTDEFYAGGYFQHLELVSLPTGLQDQLTKIGLMSELNSRPTIIQKAAFAAYLGLVCQVITTLPETTTEADSLRAISAVTLNFRPALAITEPV